MVGVWWCWTFTLDCDGSKIFINGTSTLDDSTIENQGLHCRKNRHQLHAVSVLVKIEGVLPTVFCI